MNPANKRILPHVWNALILLFIAFACTSFIPKIRAQFTYPHATPDMTAMGYVGVGLLIAAVICGLSLLSFFWIRVPAWFRLFAACGVVTLVVGYFKLSDLPGSDPEAYGTPVRGAEMVAFFGTLAVFTLPLIVTGYGYPGLILRFVERERKVG